MRGLSRVVMLVTALTLLVAPPLAGAQTPRAERPIYTLGERWIRSDGVYDLIRIENGRYIVAASADRQVHLTQDLALAKVQKGEYVYEFDPPPISTFPHGEGKGHPVFQDSPLPGQGEGEGEGSCLRSETPSPQPSPPRGRGSPEN